MAASTRESQGGRAVILPKIFERFMNGSPVTVMLRGILEHALPAKDIDQLFTDTAEQQYTRELLFSSVVDLMGEVVCRIRPSVHASYQAEPSKLGVSLRAVYDKLEHTEPGVSAALVAHRDLWVADRNFCTTGFWFALAARRAFGVIRHHAHLSWQPVSRRRYVGRVDTGRVHEQRVCIHDDAGKELELRRITIQLDT